MSNQEGISSYNNLTGENPYVPYQYLEKPFSTKKEADAPIIQEWVNIQAKTVKIPEKAEITKSYDPNINVELIENPDSNQYAFFSPLRDGIEIGGKGSLFSEGITTAMLRHERCHAYFFSLPTEHQARIVDTIVKNDPEAVLEMYKLLRNIVPDKYFSFENAENIKRKLEKSNLRAPYTRFITVLVNGEEIAINASRIVNELLAYSVTMKTDREYVDYQEFINWNQPMQRALEMREHTLSEPSRKIIQEYGFQNIYASDLYERLIEMTADRINIIDESNKDLGNLKTRKDYIQ